MTEVYLDPSLRSFGMCRVEADRDSFDKQAEGVICELGKEAAVRMLNNVKAESQQEYELLPKFQVPTATDDKAMNKKSKVN